MELSIKDRILLLNEVLPQFDSMDGIVMKMSIIEKLKLSEEESSGIVCNRLPTGVMEVGFKDADFISMSKDVALTDDELSYIKKRVRMIDSNGMISADNIATYRKVLEEPFADGGNEETQG
jgi:hypothetical protein